MLFNYEARHGGAPKGVAQPLRFDGPRQPLGRRPPELGEHSCELLMEASYNEEQTTSLIAHGIIHANDSSLSHLLVSPSGLCC
jgi:crotonobetainyl-CoA:carnitine CoA-transferase CaiB-like acyl-CoA transferase